MQAIAFRLVRVIFWIALAIYLGGLISLGAIAAPGIFQSLEASKATVADPMSPLVTPRQLGGEVFGDVLARFSLLEIIACASMIACVLAESVLMGGAMLRKPWHLLRIGFIVCSLGLLLYDKAILFPQVIKAREAWHTAMKTSIAINAVTSATAPTTAATRPTVDPQFETDFTALHKSSESLAHTKVYFLLAILGLTALASTNVPPMRVKKVVVPPPKNEIPPTPSAG